MNIKITPDEARTVLPAVPVCVGCARPASHVRQSSLTPLRPKAAAADQTPADSPYSLFFLLLELVHLAFSKKPPGGEGSLPGLLDASVDHPPERRDE